MSKSEIYELAFKLVGIAIFFKFLDLLTNIFTYLFQFFQSVPQNNIETNSDTLILFLWFIFNLATLGVFSFFLLFKTESIVKLICKSNDYIETEIKLFNKNIIYEISFTLIGCFIIIWFFPVFITSFFKIFINSNFYYANEMNDFIVLSLKLILGVLCIVFAKKISLYLNKISNKQS